MNWYEKLFKAAKDTGHGDTLHGQMMVHEIKRLRREIANLRSAAAEGGPDSVLPRWKGEVRQRIFKLPAVERIDRMSMYELDEVSAELKDIQDQMGKYSVKRFKEIMDADHLRGS